MRHLVVIYMALCGILPFIYGSEPTALYLFGNEYDLWYLIRDVLAVSGFGFAAAISFEANETIRKKLAKTVIFQTLFQLGLIFFDNCAYDPFGNFINCTVIIISIIYIYRKHKSHEPAYNKGS